VDHSSLTPQEFEQFRSLILKLCGIHISENKVTLLSNRIRRRLRATGITDFTAYLNLLQSGQPTAELADFINVVTTNETAFFRTEKHFHWIQNEFLNDLLTKNLKGEHSKHIKLWSAACSTGEEPYTLAMCLIANRARLPGWTYEILATDINQQVLQKARLGVYDSKISQQFPDSNWRDYFDKSANSHQWVVKPEVRKLVKFQHHNLIATPPAIGFDCILIRNVLIYFNRESKRMVIDHLINALKPGGFLVTGPSEGVFDMLGMLTRYSPFAFQKT